MEIFLSEADLCCLGNPSIPAVLFLTPNSVMTAYIHMGFAAKGITFASSVNMIACYGCNRVIIFHSQRRQNFSDELNDLFNQSVRRSFLLEDGLKTEGTT